MTDFMTIYRDLTDNERQNDVSRLVCNNKAHLFISCNAACECHICCRFESHDMQANKDGFDQCLSNKRKWLQKLGVSLSWSKPLLSFETENMSALRASVVYSSMYELLK